MQVALKAVLLSAICALLSASSAFAQVYLRLFKARTQKRTVRLAIWRAHREAAGWDHDHIGAGVAFLERIAGLERQLGGGRTRGRIRGLPECRWGATISLQQANYCLSTDALLNNWKDQCRQQTVPVDCISQTPGASIRSTATSTNGRRIAGTRATRELRRRMAPPGPRVIATAVFSAVARSAHCQGCSARRTGSRTSPAAETLTSASASRERFLRRESEIFFRKS